VHRRWEQPGGDPINEAARLASRQDGPIG